MVVRACLFVLALAAAPAALAGEVAVTLREQVLVAASVLTLADLAEVASADPAVQQAFARLPAGASPMPGTVLRRSAAELAALVQGAALQRGQTVRWHGASEVMVRRQAGTVEPQALEAAARSAVLTTFGKQYERLDLQLAAPLRALAVPGQPFSLRVRSLQGPLSQRVVIWIEVIAGGAVQRVVAVPLQVQGWAQVYRARHALPAGATPGGDDLMPEQCDVLALREAPLRAPPAGSARLRFAVAAGTLVPAAALAPAAAVLRGDAVRLLSRVGAIEVATGAVAQEEGALGQTVRVLPLSGAAVVSGTLVAAATVVIEGN